MVAGIPPMPGSPRKNAMLCEKLNFATKFMFPNPQILGKRSKSVKLCCKILILYVALKDFEKIKEKLTMPGFPWLPLCIVRARICKLASWSKGGAKRYGPTFQRYRWGHDPRAPLSLRLRQSQLPVASFELIYRFVF